MAISYSEGEGGGNLTAPSNPDDLDPLTLFVNSTHLPDLGSDPDLDEEYDLYVKGLWSQVEATRFIVQKILVPIVVTFGVTGNILNIAVLSQRCMRTSSTNIYLTALAIMDVLYLIFSVTMGLKHYDNIKVLESYIRYRKPFGKPLVDIFSNSAVWITLTFTVERYIGVCYPMKGKIWCTPDRARIITVVVCLVAAILTFPEFFENKAVYVTDPVTNVTTLKSKVTSFGSAHSYQWGYTYTNQALFTFIPLVCLSVFNGFLIRAVFKAANQRKAMSKVTVTLKNDRSERQRSEQHKITVMLIVVVIVFLICQVPQAVQNLYITYLQVTERFKAHHPPILVMTANVFNLLVMINSSMNFILYSSFSMRFRRTFKRLFCRCLLDRLNTDHLYSDAYHGNGDGSKTNLILHHTTCTNISSSPRRSPRPSAADIYNSQQHRLSNASNICPHHHQHQHRGSVQGNLNPEPQQRHSVVSLNTDKSQPQYTTKNGYLDVNTAQGNTSVV